MEYLEANIEQIRQWVKQNYTHRMISISIGNYTVREVLMKNRTRVWRNIYNSTSA
jgi:hypothetical protein